MMNELARNLSYINRGQKPNKKRADHKSFKVEINQ